MRVTALLMASLLLLPAVIAQCEGGKIETTFVFVPDAEEDIRSVSLRGSFNAWGETQMVRMQNGSWSATLCLEPGKHLYKYFINGEWPTDMSAGHNGKPFDLEADGYESDGFDGKNAYRLIEISDFYVTHDSKDPAYLCVSEGRLILRIKAPKGSVEGAEVVTGKGTFPMEKQLWTSTSEIWRASLPAEQTEYTIRIKHDGEDTILRDKFSSSSFNELQWVDDGVSYQIFPDRFFNGNESNDNLAAESDEYNFNAVNPVQPILSSWNAPITPLHCCHQYFGGDLEGVTEKLDYLDSIGVKLIYLNPIFYSGSAHGYDTYDYLRPDGKFGDNESLAKLLDEAHGRGIRVIFDFVPNHTGMGFFAFQDIVEKGRESRYWDWYTIKKYPFEPGDGEAYECWWDVPSLPKLNHTNPEVKEYLYGVVDSWLDFGFDGLRIDVPNEVVDAHSFFVELRDRVKREHPEAYIVGEIWSVDPSWLQGDQFDSLMNYALGREILLPFANGTMSAEEALYRLGNYFSAYGESVSGMGFNVVSTHDTGRLLSDLGGGKFGERPEGIGMLRLEMLETLLFSMPGTPVIFQGDERGITGEKELYDSHRYPIQWDACNREIFTYFGRLSRMRGSLPQLQSNSIFLHRSEGNVISFFRGGDRNVLVIANNGYDSQAFSLPDGRWRVADSSETFEGSVNMPPLRATVLVRA
jgi:glycosidase